MSCLHDTGTFSGIETHFFTRGENPRRCAIACEQQQADLQAAYDEFFDATEARDESAAALQTADQAVADAEQLLAQTQADQAAAQTTHAGNVDRVNSSAQTVSDATDAYLACETQTPPGAEVAIRSIAAKIKARAQKGCG